MTHALPKNKFQDSPQASLFIRKSHQLLQEQKFTNIVDWNEEGTSIVIKRPLEFAQIVLPTYFKHRNLTSFVRQLNMYEFRKRRTQMYDHVYFHPLFQRDCEHLLIQIKRRKPEDNVATIQKCIETLHAHQATQQAQSPEELNGGQLLRKLNKETSDRLEALKNQVKELTLQNEALQNQIRHKAKREDLLVSFMSEMMKTRGVTLDQLPQMLDSQLKDFNLKLPDYTSSNHSESITYAQEEEFISSGDAEEVKSRSSQYQENKLDKIVSSRGDVLNKRFLDLKEEGYESLGKTLIVGPSIDLREPLGVVNANANDYGKVNRELLGSIGKQQSLGFNDDYAGLDDFLNSGMDFMDF